MAGVVPTHLLGPRRPLLTPTPAPPVAAGGGGDPFAERLVLGAQEARIRNLQAALDATRSQHAEEAARQQAAAAGLREDAVAMKRELAEQEAKIWMHSGELANRDALLAERTREEQRAQEHLDVARNDIAKLQRQLRLLMEQLRQSQGEAGSALLEKERALGPLTEKAEELLRAGTVKQRQVELMQEDLDAAARQNGALRAEAAAALGAAEQEREGRRLEAEAKDAVIAALRGELEAHAGRYERRERLLRARCRLLQTWCFNAWWSLEAGVDALASIGPGGGQEGNLAGAGAGTPTRRPDVLPRRKLPLPPDWRGVLRFQATLFHWLAAEAARGRSEAASLTSPAAEAAGRRERELAQAAEAALADVAGRQAAREALLQERRSLEAAAWRQERFHLEEALASCAAAASAAAAAARGAPGSKRASVLAAGGSFGQAAAGAEAAAAAAMEAASPSSPALAALRARAAGEAADLDERLRQVHPLQPMEKLIADFVASAAAAANAAAKAAATAAQLA